MSDIIQDLRFAVRAFARAPRFTVPAVLAIALGIGAAVAVFSVVRGVLIAPLPYRDPDGIVAIWETNLKRNRPRNVVSAANFVAWRERNRSFEHLGIVGPARATLLIDGQPEEVAGFSASSDVLTILGVTPQLGRAYTAEEDIAGRSDVMVLGHEFWQSRFGGRADVVGSAIVANGRARTVVGVLPAGFTLIGQRADFLTPYGWTMEQLRAAPGRGTSHGLARLKSGVSIQQAQSEMQTIAAQLEVEAPQRNTGWSVTLVPVHEQMVEQIRPALNVLAGGVAFVLLIACANVANLLLARAKVRARELGVRTALGAGRGRLVRQLLTESVLLGGVGGALGWAFAWALHRGLLTFVAEGVPIPRLAQVELDLPVLGFALALTLVTSLLFGFLPAIVASRSIDAAMRAGGRHGGSPSARRALSSLVVAEVALALVLLTAASLLIRSFARLQAIDPGFRADGVLTARVNTPAARYDPPASAAFYTRVIDRLATLPGVRSAAGVSFLPLAGPGIATSFYRADRPEPAAGEAPVADVRPVTPGFFRTMGIPHVEGRDVATNDAPPAAPVALVSASLARAQWPGESAIGRRLRVNIGPPTGLDVQVVGIVGDVRINSLEGDPRSAIYLPHTHLAVGVMTLVIRTDAEPTSLVSLVTSVVRGIDPELPLADVRTMEEVVARTIARPRIVAALLSVFAVLALVLAGVGVYGVMAYSVAQRTQEFGVRMALGATPASVRRLVFKQSLRLAVVGVGAGMALAAALTRTMGSLLYDTAALDPLAFGGTAAAMVAVTMLASYVPARRGTLVAPVESLRAE